MLICLRFSNVISHLSGSLSPGGNCLLDALPGRFGSLLHAVKKLCSRHDAAALRSAAFY
jgi:hypothetical protein